MSRPKPEPVQLNSVTDFEHALDTISHQKLVLIDCHADWCGPTLAITPFLNQVSRIHPSKILSYKKSYLMSQLIFDCRYGLILMKLKKEYIWPQYR